MLTWRRRLNWHSETVSLEAQSDFAIIFNDCRHSWEAQQADAGMLRDIMRWHVEKEGPAEQAVKLCK